MLGELAKIGGKSQYISQRAAKVVKNADACGIYRTANGFGQRLTKFYPGPNATLTESCKTFGNGKWIEQKVWSWPDGSLRALTRKSDGFLSSVSRDAKGKVTSKLISKNNQHLVEKSSGHMMVNGKMKNVPYENYVNGDKISRIVNGELSSVDKSASTAEYFVKGAREAASQSFRCIG